MENDYSEDNYYNGDDVIVDVDNSEEDEYIEIPSALYHDVMYLND